MATLTDARGAMTTYEYDGHDRPKKTRLPNPTTANVSSTTDYEELTWGTGTTAGLVIAQRLRDGTSVALAYDSLGRATFANAPGTTPDVTTAYDSFGRVTSLSQTGHTLAYVYDQLSRLVSEAQPNGTVSYQYDAAGRRAKLTYPGGFFVDYDWNAAGDLLKIRENGAASGVGVLAIFAYDDLGRRMSLTRGNGGVTSYGFDAASRLSALTQDAAGTADDLTNSFSYSPASQISRRRRPPTPLMTGRIRRTSPTPTRPTFSTNIRQRQARP